MQGCSSQRLSRTLDAVDWISERNVHDWLHDAVYGLHLAVGWRAGQMKVGSMARGERTAKWNEMLRIEEAVGSRARFAGWRPLRR